ncbi:S8 family serine peptidase (plasmid) [Streptomyces sp. NBC_01717]|uniref:S8 family serine peptidase n=1 Tax=Streptomyces sp. NBC_01717 TaxID=2975918 RepID=UPI002E336437|nr:S8 family serine peptidase [Streptomyces sp. NBC_01717]
MTSHLIHRLITIAVAASAVLPAASGPAVADQTADTAFQTSADPGAISLPPLPVRLGAGQPCTVASQKTATAATWSGSALGLHRAHQLSEGEGVTVALVDTGVGSGVPALSGRVTALGGAGTDCPGHGSFAAGLIAAAPEKGKGVVGLAPQARILAVSGTDDRGAPSVQRVAQGIRASAKRGAEVIYVGATLRTGRAELASAVAYAVREDALVVAPAAPDAVPREELGPNGELPRGPYWPAALPDVLSVVDFGPSGVRQEKAPPAYRPELAAPGGGMVSVGPRGSGHYIGSGASLAAACAAGAAALVRAYHPEMTAEQVRRQLLEASYPSDIPRLDPYAAMSTVLPAARSQSAIKAAKPPAARMPAPPDNRPRTRGLAIAAVCLAVVLLVGAAGVVIPLGRARGWLPPGR